MADFLGNPPSTNTATSTVLPPPPPKSTEPMPQTTLQAEGVKLDAEKSGELSKLARERDEQRR